MSIKKPSVPKYHEGWVEIKESYNAWKRHWLVLKGNELHLYKSGDKAERLIWRLELGTGVRITAPKGDAKKGFQFELNAQKKKFKFCGENERDLWVAFIEGLSQGNFDRNKKLLPGQITLVDEAIEDCKMLQTARLCSSPSSADEGIGSEFSGDTSADSLNCGGPFKNHKFYNDCPGQPRQQTVPTWFFDNCSRQLSEMVLERGREYGNVLMRESVTFKDNGSYVISLRRDCPKGSEYEHFEVIQTATGYQINVENIHCPCKCLQDVMDYFLQAAGSSYTRAFTTNNLATLGIHWPYYQSVIQSVGPGTTNQTARSGSGNCKTWSAKRSSTLPESSPQSRTIGRSENPYREGISVLPTSLRDVMRRGRPDAPAGSQISHPPPPASHTPPPPSQTPQPPPQHLKPTTPDPSQMFRPAAPIPASTTTAEPAAPAISSLEAQIAAKAQQMNLKRRSSVPAKLFPDTPSSTPPPPPTAPPPPSPPPSPAPVPHHAPYVSPVTAAPSIPVAPPAPGIPVAPPVPIAPPPPPAPGPPPAPSMKSPTRPALKSVPSPTSAPPALKPVPRSGPQVTFARQKAPPPTKPKGRRSSESDIPQPPHLKLAGASIESGIVEEDHPSVRDVKHMFDAVLSPSNAQTKPMHPRNETRHVEQPPPAPTPTSPVQGDGRYRHLSNQAYANISPAFSNRPISHLGEDAEERAYEKWRPVRLPRMRPPRVPLINNVPQRAAVEEAQESVYEDLAQYVNIGKDSQYYKGGASAVSASQLPPPAAVSNRVPAPPVPPPAPQYARAHHTALPPPQSLALPLSPPPTNGDLPSSSESREDFKRRLESLIGGPSVTPKSPTSPAPARLSTPLPPAPASYENIYSEPA